MHGCPPIPNEYVSQEIYSTAIGQENLSPNNIWQAAGQFHYT